jgi:voltage-gated potassium channel
VSARRSGPEVELSLGELQNHTSQLSITLASLKSIVEDPDSPAGKLFAIGVQLLIFVSLVTFAVSTLSNLSDRTIEILDWVEVITVILFTGEYLLRILAADNKLSYVFSFFGLVDLLAIVPFYVGTPIDLRAVRSIRFLILFRLFKMARYNTAVKRFHLAFLIAKEELVLFLAATILMLFLSATGIYYFEHDAQPDKFASVFHAMWWAVATLTTVGYGDVYPITVGGKIFTFFVLIIGLGVISVPVGLVASAFSKAREINE